MSTSSKPPGGYRFLAGDSLEGQRDWLRRFYWVPNKQARTREVAHGEGIFLRNLICHIYPTRDNLAWQWHLRKINSYSQLFNGRMIFSFALDDRTVDLSGIHGWLPQGAHAVFVLNDPELREVVSLGPLLALVESDNQREATFFCHGKGVTRQGRRGLDWSELMYSTCLDYPLHLSRSLLDSAAFGSLKKRGECFHRSWSDWHYSGSFYWLRHDALFQSAWRMMDMRWFGVESYPSLVFAPEAAHAELVDLDAEELDPYDDVCWKYMLRPTFKMWRMQREIIRKGFQQTIGKFRPTLDPPWRARRFGAATRRL